MFILFGWRGVTYRVSSGTFCCPKCGLSTGYVHKRVRRFFTLFFIPVIPLDTLGEYVECGRCGGTFLPVVLSQGHQQALLAEVQHAERIRLLFDDTITHVMFLVALADGGVDEKETEAINLARQRLNCGRPSADDLSSEIARFQSGHPPVFENLAAIAGSLTDQGRAMIVNAAAQVAGAKGEPTPEQKDLVERVTSTLSTTHLRALAQSMMMPEAAGGPPIALPRAPGDLLPTIEGTAKQHPAASTPLADLRAALEDKDRR